MSLQVSALRPSRAQRLAIPAFPAGLTSRATFLAFVVVALPLIVHANRPLEGDVWWALAFGRDLVARGALPTADPFTFSLHAPQFVDAQWLNQLIFFGAYLAGSFEGVMALTGVVCALTVALLLHAGRRRSGSLPAAVASVALFTLPAVWYVYPRANPGVAAVRRHLLGAAMRSPRRSLARGAGCL